MIDGLLLYHLKDELHEKLNKARLERITGFDAQTFALTFYRFGEKIHLIISVHPKDFAIYITKHKLEQRHDSQFLQSLKKSLTGAILTSIEQHLTDRVLILKFIVYDLIDGPVEKELVFEAMGKYTNLILTQQQNIIDTYKKMFFETGRQLLPRATFEFFPSDKKPFTEFSFTSVLTPKDIADQYMGISRMTASFLFEHRMTPLDLPINPTIDQTKTNVYFADIFDELHEKKYVGTISELFDQPKKARKLSKVSYQQFIEKQLKKYKRKAIQLEEQQLKNNDLLKTKQYGDLIYQSLLPLHEKHTSLQVSDVNIPLDPTKTLNENAQYYYKKYQKAKRGILPIKEQIKNNQYYIDLFQTYETYLTLSQNNDLDDLASDLSMYGYQKHTKSSFKRKKTKPSIFKIIDDDATYIIGKNDKQNNYITHQIAHSNDYWFHVKDAPGSHLIVQANVLNEPIIRKAAMLAAYYSSLSLSSSIPVDYTKVRYLKKIPKMPGYHVTYTHQKTIYIDIEETQIKSWINL